MCGRFVFLSSGEALAPDVTRARRYADCAMTLLRQAVAKGYKDVRHLQKEAALDTLRSRAEFKEVLQEI